MQSWDSSLLVCDVLQLFLGLTVSDFQYSLHLRVTCRMWGVFMYVFLLCWWVAIIQPERSVILEVRILLESEVIAMLQVCSYL